MPLPEPVPDIHSLDLLRSVAEFGSIRKAAVAHRISQPAASMRLHALEGLLNLQLLDRSTGRARLTVAGAAVVEWSSEVLEGMRHLLVAVGATRNDGETHLRIVASMTVAEYLIPIWLERLRSADPHIIISLRMGNSEHVIDVMRRADADIGFVEGSHAPSDLKSDVVQKDELVLVVAPTHPWAFLDQPIRVTELATTPLVLREPGSGTREVLESALRARGLTVCSLVELASTTAIKSAIASGTGPGVVSRLAADWEIQQGRLFVVPVEGLSLERFIRVVWPRHRTRSHAAEGLMQAIGPAGRENGVRLNLVGSDQLTLLR